jgi:hypothetical protein
MLEASVLESAAVFVGGTALCGAMAGGAEDCAISVPAVRMENTPQAASQPLGTIF